MVGFLAFWSVLDAMFTFIDDAFRDIFNCIPVAAIPFLIAIFCYSVVAMMIYFIKKQPVGNRKVGLKAFYWAFVGFFLLFSIWRFGIVVMLEDKLTIETFSQFFVNLVYVAFGMILIVMFYKNVPWLKKVLLILIWSIFLLLTFLICPALGESKLSESTVWQVLLVAFLFVVPNSLNMLQKAKESDV